MRGVFGFVKGRRAKKWARGNLNIKSGATQSPNSEADFEPPIRHGVKPGGVSWLVVVATTTPDRSLFIITLVRQPDYVSEKMELPA